MFHPLTRVWIEIEMVSTNVLTVLFHPLTRVWIEIANSLA